MVAGFFFENNFFGIFFRPDADVGDSLGVNGSAVVVPVDVLEEGGDADGAAFVEDDVVEVVERADLTVGDEVIEVDNKRLLGHDAMIEAARLNR